MHREKLVELVGHYPGRTAAELRSILARAGGPVLSGGDLNQMLRDNEALGWLPGSGVSRRWYTHSSIDSSQSSTFSDHLGLYPWQREALDWWADCGYRGVIEAVTGAGKTRLAVAAVAQQLEQEEPTVIVVPSIALIYQWESVLREQLIDPWELDVSIGFLGDGKYDVNRLPDILIATSHSACKYLLIPHNPTGLLIADEVHHYGAQRWSEVLEDKFDRRMGLTATYEREDSGVDQFLDPYFGGNMFRVDYRRALHEGVIAPFKIAFVGVRFSRREQEAYEEHAEKSYRYRTKLINVYGLPEEPFGEFMRQVNLLRQGGHDEATGLARGYLNAFSKRRQALANARAKFDRVADLASAIEQADRSILFAQTQSAARHAVDQLTSRGIGGAVLTSSMDMSERKKVFAAFEDGEHELVAAPRLLDEGIDVPAADLAIVLASNRSRRQMVQRMGRVVRKKDDGRLARLAVLYVEDTSEDPLNGANEDFLYLVTDVAYEIEYFDSSSSAARICSYLNDWCP